MFKKLLKIAFLFMVILLQAQNQFKVGAEQLNAYLPLIENKSIAIIANQTSVIERYNQEPIHLVYDKIYFYIHNYPYS